ncbi:hypothetical protein MtrunA17_Chr6g0476941 [Medicago truncatula]|uniref:Uncharacterized protein n=1 Tax=Medicago truncatula TaxID=3880 RepID=A0A396HFN0_MEDTR|nr:hypothetical protein MtrunA17_Chr6g0476941 [Medicago truncatula]
MSELQKLKAVFGTPFFKKIIKVMITPTDTLDDLKAQLNTYFEYLCENQYTRHLLDRIPCMVLRAGKDEDMWKMDIYEPWLIRDDSDVSFMFRYMLKIIYYICVFVTFANV